MPKNNGNGRKKADWKGYVNWNPNQTERDTIKAALLTADQADGLMASLVDDGYKLSFYHDDYRNVMCLGVYGHYEDCKNPGKMLVIPHPDPRVALSALSFFLDEICENGVWVDQKDLDNPYAW